jgi:endoglucanase
MGLSMKSLLPALDRVCLGAALVLRLPGCAHEAPANAAALSESIKLDQVGYLPSRTKLAMVTDAQATGAFRVRRAADGSEALSGTLGPPVSDPDTGDTVRIADFSALSQAGSFSLDVAGVGVSHEFDVGPAVYASVFTVAMRSYYGQRCGTAVDLAPSHPGYRHPACHVAGTPNPDALMHASSGASGEREASQGWHDAGDYGKYVVNSGITVGELLWTYDAFADRVGPVRLDIPESGNAVPDVLDEVRWNLDWMAKMQDRDGGVWPKLTSERFGSFVMPHLDDGGPRYVIGSGAAPYKSSCATGDFAAVMASASRVYRPFDPAFAAAALASAERAWRWVSANPNVTFRNCCGVQTGEYGDGDCSDERLWAAAELYRATGAPEYDAYFTAGYAARVPAVTAGPPQSWPDVRNLAMFAYYFSGQSGASEPVRARIREDALAAADAIVARTNANPYRVSLRPEDYVWGSNGVVANYGVLLMLANAMRPTPAYVEAAADDLHYLLGRNTFGLSWVTQVGDRPFRNPHHRPSGADANAEPWPGLLSGGPNRYGGDPVIDAMPASPPARRYRDDQASYASNEIAINWNAPLVFLLASLLPEGSR